MRLVYQALAEACEDSSSKGRRNSAETIMGYSTACEFDTPIGEMLRALAKYADHHAKRFGPLGDDYFLGAAWLDCIKGVRAMLNGETGRLDCGDVDRAIIDVAKAAGFPEDRL